MDKHRGAAAVLIMALAIGAEASAQQLGTFDWQLQPYCNVVSVSITQQGNLYTADGFDDQCGAPQRAPLVGVVGLNPDGSIGFGLHVVTVPGGRGLQIDARISLATLGGAWTDSAGNSGNFVFNARSGGSPRPPPTIPTGMIAPGSITATQLATGAVTASKLEPGLIGTLAQARVTGSCTNGRAIRNVRVDGTVDCTDLVRTFDVGPYDMVAMAMPPDGRPVFSFRRNDGLWFARCASASCVSLIGPYLLDSANQAGYFSSIAIGADGFPVVSYGAAPGAFGELRVTHCRDSDCLSRVTVGVEFDAGKYNSIAIGIDGLPVISHYDIGNGALRVTHCGNSECSAGNASTWVDDNLVTNVGNFTSIAIGTDGLPIVSHQDISGGLLRVSHCGNTACTSGNFSAVADGIGSSLSPYGADSSIAIGRDGLPIISHTDGVAHALRVTHCGNLTCSAGNVSTTISKVTAGLEGKETSIAIGTDGLAVIRHTGIGGLILTHCGNVTCSQGNVSRDVVPAAGGSIPGQHTRTIAIGSDGLPVVAFSSSGSKLGVVFCGTHTCQ